MKVQVCIVGGGPSGLMLSQLLHLQGIDTVVLEKYSREHVLSRIRAGVLEHGFAKLMREAQCGERMDREGEIHEGFEIAHAGEMYGLDTRVARHGNQLAISNLEPVALLERQRIPSEYDLVTEGRKWAFGHAAALDVKLGGDFETFGQVAREDLRKPRLEPRAAHHRRARVAKTLPQRLELRVGHAGHIHQRYASSRRRFHCKHHGTER